MNESIIEVKNLQKSFKDKKVLRGVDFSIKRSEIFALLGFNGAGKTTAINILATLLKADAGQASICGYDVDKQPEKVRECISLTGQFAAVDEILSGQENLELIARLRNVENPKTVASELLQRFGLSEAASQRVATYSGGMLRRLDIAMSLVGKPPVIFLDEPTTGLDPSGRLEVWQTIKELSDLGITIFLTTQYLEEAEELADKIAILNDGVIIAQGTLNELQQLLPATKIEYVEKKPTLEEVFLTILKRKSGGNDEK